MLSCIQAAPGFKSGIAFFHWYRIKAPLQFTGNRIERLQEAGGIKVIAGTNQYMVIHDNGGRCRKILFIKTGNFGMPAFFTGPGIQGYQVVIGCFQKQVITPHTHTAVADVRTTDCFPPVVPQYSAVPGIHGPGIVRC